MAFAPMLAEIAPAVKMARTRTATWKFQHGFRPLPRLGSVAAAGLV